MSFGATPFDGSSPTPIPMPTVVPDGTNQPTATEGGPIVTTDGNNLAPVSMYVKDGNDLTLGLTTQSKATDGSTTSWSAIQLLKGILNSLLTSIAVTGTFWQATQPTSAASGAFVDGALASIGTTTQSKATDGSTTSWSVIQLLKGIFNSLLTSIAVTQSGTWTVQPGNTPNTTAWLEQPVAGTTGGATPSHTISAASTNSTNIKGSAGLLYNLTLSNTNASSRYFKLYDKATAPTVGTDTPKETIQVPGNGTVIKAYPVGKGFVNGIGFAATGAMADADTTAISAGDLSMDLDYK